MESENIFYSHLYWNKMYKYIVLKNPSINTICLHFTDALDWDVREYNLAPNITQKKNSWKTKKTWGVKM